MLLQQGGNFFFQNNCIDFSANINFLGIPDNVMQAARAGLVAPAAPDGQPDGRSLDEYVAEMEGVGPGQIFCGNGAAEVLKSLLRALQPKKALLPVPGFEEYTRALAEAGCAAECFYTEPSEGYDIPLDGFCARITKETDMVLLCNPSNPTAVLFDKEFIRAVLERCREMQAQLVLDECYLDFVEEAEKFRLNPEEADGRLFVLKDFTRVFAMPGIRLGYGVCKNESLVSRMQASVLPLAKVSVMAQRAGIACTKARGFVRETAKATARERAWLLDEFQRIGISHARGEANFVFFKSRPGLHAYSIRHGIMLRDCSNMEGMEKGSYRVTVRSREENEKLAGVLDGWMQEAE